jgi:two-component sensor histidine kinase
MDRPLVWRELDGPPVSSKVQANFGTDLIRNLIPHELGGEVDLVFATGGVNCRIEIPAKWDWGRSRPPSLIQ